MAARRKRAAAPLVVTVTKRKGGVGGTTIATGLASVLAERGPVLLVDLDPQGSASQALGLAITVPGSAEALAGQVVEPSTVDRAPNLAVWVGSPYLDRTECAPGALGAALANTRPFAAVVVDCPPGNPGLELVALAAANVALVVTTLEPMALRTVARATAGLGKLRAAVVANKLRASQLEREVAELAEALRLPVLPVRQDAAAVRASARGVPLTLAAPRSKVLDDVRGVAAWLLG